MAEHIQVTSPSELAEVVPYLVGFAPEESLVVLVARQGRVVVTARVDIADLSEPGAAEQTLDAMWGRFPDATGTLMAYTADHETGWQLIERCAAHRPEAGLRQLVIDGDTWHLPSGETGSVDRYGAIAAEATVRGLQRRGSRSELESTFATAALTEPLMDLIEAAIGILPDRGDVGEAVDRMHALIQTNLSEPVAPAAAVQLALLTSHPDAHEVALLSVTRANAEAHFRLWRQVTNQVPDAFAKGPLFLAGLAAWVSGDGAAANIAIDKSIDLAPGGRHSPDRLLSALINTVTPPDAWRRIRQDALDQAKPEVRAAIGDTAATCWEKVSRSTGARRPEPPAVEPGRGMPI